MSFIGHMAFNVNIKIYGKHHILKPNDYMIRCILLFSLIIFALLPEQIYLGL